MEVEPGRRARNVNLEHRWAVDCGINGERLAAHTVLDGFKAVDRFEEGLGQKVSRIAKSIECF